MFSCVPLLLTESKSAVCDGQDCDLRSDVYSSVYSHVYSCYSCSQKVQCVVGKIAILGPIQLHVVLCTDFFYGVDCDCASKSNKVACSHVYIHVHGNMHVYCSSKSNILACSHVCH